MRRSRTAAQSHPVGYTSVARRGSHPLDQRTKALPSDSSGSSGHGFARDGDPASFMPMYHQVEELITRMRVILNRRGYKARTIETYERWVRRFAKACPWEDPEELDRSNVEVFLTELTTRYNLAPRSRNQASSALAFFFRDVLQRDDLGHMPRAREFRRIPSVLSHRQVQLVLRELSGKYRLMGSLMYGTGLRLTECHQLRVKDVDFDLYQIAVREGKGGKDRWVMLPEKVAPAVRRQVERVRRLHKADRKDGYGWAQLPGALFRKDPEAGFQLGWQFLFPASRLTEDPLTGRLGRYHLHPTAMQRHIKTAARRSGIQKPVTCHSLRRSFATEMLRAGYDVRTVQRLMGHRDVRTTMIYVEAVSDTGIGMRSPLDRPSDPD